MADDLQETRAQVGALIRRLRRERGMTLDELAQKVGCVKGYLSTIERGLRSPPREDLVAKLEEALGTSSGLIARAAAWCRTPQAVRAEIKPWTSERGSVDVRAVDGCAEAEVVREVWDGDGRPMAERGDWVVLGPRVNQDAVEEGAWVALESWAGWESGTEGVVVRAAGTPGVGVANSVRRVLSVMRVVKQDLGRADASLSGGARGTDQVWRNRGGAGT